MPRRNNMLPPQLVHTQERRHTQFRPNRFSAAINCFLPNGYTRIRGNLLRCKRERFRARCNRRKRSLSKTIRHRHTAPALFAQLFAHKRNSISAYVPLSRRAPHSLPTRTLAAGSVEHRPVRIDFKSVRGEQMALHRRQFRAAHVDEFAAVFTLAVKIRFRIVPFFTAGVFETGGTVSVDDVFVDDALFDHVFELAVHRRRTDRFAVRFKIRPNRMHRDVRTFHRFQKCEQFFVLFCFVLTFRIHTRKFLKMRTVLILPNFARCCQGEEAEVYTGGMRRYKKQKGSRSFLFSCDNFYILLKCKNILRSQRLLVSRLIKKINQWL